MSWMVFLLGGTIGLALGLLGGGGSIIAVPAFVYVLGFDAKVAIAMSLGIVGAVSVIGAVGHWRAGNVDVRLAALFGAVAMAGTYGGARLSVYLNGGTQLLLFSLVMLAAAISMLKKNEEPTPETGGRHIVTGDRTKVCRRVCRVRRAY